MSAIDPLRVFDFRLISDLMPQDAATSPPDWPTTLRAILLGLATLLIFPVMGIWPLLGMGSESLYYGGPLSVLALNILFLSPVLLLGAIGSAVLSKWRYPRTLLSLAWALFLLVSFTWLAVFKFGWLP